MKTSCINTMIFGPIFILIRRYLFGLYDTKMRQSILGEKKSTFVLIFIISCVISKSQNLFSIGSKYVMKLVIFETKPPIFYRKLISNSWKLDWWKYFIWKQAIFTKNFLSRFKYFYKIWSLFIDHLYLETKNCI